MKYFILSVVPPISIQANILISVFFCMLSLYIINKNLNTKATVISVFISISTTVIMHLWLRHPEYIPRGRMYELMQTNGELAAVTGVMSSFIVSLFNGSFKKTINRKNDTN